MSTGQRTKDFLARRTLEGKSKREIICCLRRHVAREIFGLVTNPPTAPPGADLRTARLEVRIAPAAAAETLGTWPIRISELERGLVHHGAFAHRYEIWPRPAQAA